MTTPDLIVFPILLSLPLIALVRVLVQMHEIADEKIRIEYASQDRRHGPAAEDDPLPDAGDLIRQPVALFGDRPPPKLL